MFEDENVVVKQSPIEGLGVFAKRAFTVGEVVLTWHPESATEDMLEEMSQDFKERYLNTLADGTRVLMGIPERYVNSSDDPNTRTAGTTDVAIRDIEAGEEITGNYPV